MMPASDITKWGVDHPWSTRDQIEQDFLLSQAICVIANDSLLGNELIIRGGTAFHKLFLPKPGSFDSSILTDNKLDTTPKNRNHDFIAIYGDGTVESAGIPLFVFNYLDYKL